MARPKCQLIGENGNIFNLMAIASRTLREAGFKKQAAEMRERVFKADSYNRALQIIMEYVEVK